MVRLRHSGYVVVRVEENILDNHTTDLTDGGVPLPSGPPMTAKIGVSCLTAHNVADLIIRRASQRRFWRYDVLPGSHWIRLRPRGRLRVDCTLWVLYDGATRVPLVFRLLWCIRLREDRGNRVLVWIIIVTIVITRPPTAAERCTRAPPQLQA